MERLGDAVWIFLPFDLCVLSPISFQWKNIMYVRLYMMEYLLCLWCFNTHVKILSRDSDVGLVTFHKPSLVRFLCRCIATHV